MAGREKARFSELVAQTFSTEQDNAKTLWVQLAHQFDSEGPESAKEHLAAERQQLVDRVKKIA